MQVNVNKETTLCISLAAKPSNFGTRFHNYLYRELKLNFLYKAFKTSDINSTIGGIRSLGIRGCGVSMPYKEAVIPLVDELDSSVQGIQSVNTIVNTDGYLKAYNTDYLAIATLLKEHHVDPNFTFYLQGAGGMAKAVACALRDAGFTQGTIVARNEQKGRALAKQYGFAWAAQTPVEGAQLLINATPLGMQGSDTEQQCAFPTATIADAQVIFDVVAMPELTPLITQAKVLGKSVITGASVFALQALAQFELYTGVRPDSELFQQAAAFSRLPEE